MVCKQRARVHGFNKDQLKSIQVLMSLTQAYRADKISPNPLTRSSILVRRVKRGQKLKGNIYLVNTWNYFCFFGISEISTLNNIS